jgi:hypothetical protein
MGWLKPNVTNRRHCRHGEMKANTTSKNIDGRRKPMADAPNFDRITMRTGRRENPGNSSAKRGRSSDHRAFFLSCFRNSLPNRKAVIP